MHLNLKEFSFAGLIRLQEILKHADPEVKWLARRLTPGEDNRPLLKALKASGQMRIIIDCPAERILEYLRQANEVKFFEDYMVSLKICIFSYLKIKVKVCLFIAEHTA